MQKFSHVFGKVAEKCGEKSFGYHRKDRQVGSLTSDTWKLKDVEGQSDKRYNRKSKFQKLDRLNKFQKSLRQSHGLVVSYFPVWLCTLLTSFGGPFCETSKVLGHLHVLQLPLFRTGKGVAWCPSFYHFCIFRALNGFVISNNLNIC